MELTVEWRLCSLSSVKPVAKYGPGIHKLMIGACKKAVHTGND
jgi:hypothetical protein